MYQITYIKRAFYTIAIQVTPDGVAWETTSNGLVCGGDLEDDIATAIAEADEYMVNIWKLETDE